MSELCICWKKEGAVEAIHCPKCDGIPPSLLALPKTPMVAEEVVGHESIAAPLTVEAMGEAIMGNSLNHGESIWWTIDLDAHEPEIQWKDGHRISITFTSK